jgi:hypothetical protein
MSDDPASLERLHDIVLPPDLPWWPPAPGWIALGALLLLAATWAAWRAWRRHRANRYRREALATLENVHEAGEIAALLRRTALVIAPRAEIAALSGTAWTDWLAARCPGAMPEAVRALLAAGIYARAGAAPDSAALRAWAAHWIRMHAAPATTPERA